MLGGRDDISPLPLGLLRGLHDEARWKTPVSSLVCEVTCVFLSVRLCLLTTPAPAPPAPCGSPVLSVALCPPVLGRVAPACLLSASECHMPPNLAENRKPRQLPEGSPVIHQRMTVQLLVPILCAGGQCPGQLLPLPLLPWPAWWSGAGLDFVLSPLEAAWPDSVGAKFLFIFPGVFGVGRLRNVECCNIGKGVGETGASCPALLILLTPVLWKLQMPLCPPLPLPSPSQYPLSPCAAWARTCGPGHTSALATVWLPVV